MHSDINHVCHVLPQWERIWNQTLEDLKPDLHTYTVAYTMYNHSVTNISDQF